MKAICNIQFCFMSIPSLVCGKVEILNPRLVKSFITMQTVRHCFNNIYPCSCGRGEGTGNSLHASAKYSESTSILKGLVLWSIVYSLKLATKFLGSSLAKYIYNFLFFYFSSQTSHFIPISI